jgi:hypothetical protein
MAIFTLQDLMATSGKYYDRPAAEETINNPANANHYWRYRMHVPVEALLEDAGFLSVLRGMVQGAGDTDVVWCTTHWRRSRGWEAACSSKCGDKWAC